MLMPTMPNSWILGGTAVLVALLSGTIGYKISDGIADAKVARAEARRIECEHARAMDAKRAADETAALLTRALDAERRATAALAAKRAYQSKLKEMRNEIPKLATGHECMSGDLRMQLNTAITDGNTMSQSAADATGADASAASNTSSSAGATDADIAVWVIDAAGLYSECRARIDAIRQWDEEVRYGR